MIPVVIAAENDVVKALVNRLGAPVKCRGCGLVHPDKPEDVAELERVVRNVLSDYRVLHPFDQPETPADDDQPSLQLTSAKPCGK